MAFSAFVALGSWQVQRLHWKRDLIARVNLRINAAPVPAPTRPQWSTVTAQADEYRRVTVTGTFLNQDETLVQAATDFGAGFWVLVPLRLTDSSYVLVNRGFVTPDKRDPARRGSPQPQGVVTVTGLLRMPEPGGGFLRDNDPAAGRWYSRDVAAIGALHGVAPMAPYFIDEIGPDGLRQQAEIPALPDAWPVRGLTVVHFRDNHLSYAITWYILAAMVAAAAVFVGLLERRRCRTPAAAGEPEA
ncbi:SURF1 family protein [Pusillimonas sp. TS35]|nr:SURF1 family protein [Pusillimonas sp. TS35]